MKNLENQHVLLPEFDLRIMFLKYLNKYSISDHNTFHKDIYKERLGDLNKLISEFLEIGYLREPTFLDILDGTQTVKQLKEFLRLKGIKATGNKPELLATAIELFSEIERNEIIAKGWMYSLTPAGWEIIDVTTSNFKFKVSKFESLIVQELIKNNVTSAVNLVSEFLQTYPFPIGMGSSTERDHIIVAEMMASDYITNTMPIHTELKISLRAIIAANYLLMNSPGFSTSKISDKLLSVYPNFYCQFIVDYLNGQPTGLFTDYDSTDLADITYVFNHSIVADAFRRVELKEIMSNKRMFQGIFIMDSKNNRCKLCTGKDVKFNWEVISELPSLPKYPGCICMYLPILKRHN